MGAFERYIEKNGKINAGMAMYTSALDMVKSVSPEIAGRIVHELRDQRTHLKLIASENYSSLAVQAAMGNLLTDKYSEGFPYHRFYAGCDNVDAIETEAVESAKRLFGAEHAYVQPHSGMPICALTGRFSLREWKCHVLRSLVSRIHQTCHAMTGMLYVRFCITRDSLGSIIIQADISRMAIGRISQPSSLIAIHILSTRKQASSIMMKSKG